MKTFLLLCACSFALALAVQTGHAQTPVNFTSSNLPIIVINTHGQVILDEPKIAADMGIIANGPGVRNNLSDPFNAYNGKIGIEIRGASSQMFPKKQYAIETRDDQGKDVDVALLGMPAEADWVLSAPYTDKSLMRNVLAYKLSNDLGRYASRTRFCEVVLNGDYQGVYVLMEIIKRNKNRVNITKLEKTDVAGDAVTGGYLFKIDKLEGADTQGWYSSFPPYPGARQRIYYQYDYPKQADITTEQKAYIQNFIQGFEALMATPDYADPQNGYAQYLDLDSFAEVFILNEISRNVDGYRLSTFMHKERDGKGGKLRIGPIWDYDLAFGNADYYQGAKTTDWQVNFREPSDGFQIPFWWQKLMQDTSFTARIQSRWRELRRNVLDLARLHAVIDSIAQHVDEAQGRNFQRWRILGNYVWPNAYVGQTYFDELNYLKSWVNLRILWMDARIPELATSIHENDGGAPAGFVLEQNYPNPFNPSTTISFQLPRASQVALRILNVSGEEVATLAHSEMAAGRHEIVFAAQGLASGVYFYRLEAGNLQVTRKLLLMR